MFSPSAKAGLGVGDTLVTINDWNIEAMDNIQVKKNEANWKNSVIKKNL